MDLEWQFVEYLAGVRGVIRRILRSVGFNSVGTAYIQWTDSEKRRVVVYRRQSDERSVTLLKNRVIYEHGHQALRLRFVSSELVIDEQRHLCISDELRQTILNFH